MLIAKKSKTITSISSLIFLSLLLMIFFQNCTGVKFKGITVNELNSNSINKSYQFAIEEENTVESKNTKLLLIVDNSVSMKAAQTSLALGLKQLIDQRLLGIRITVRVVTTTKGNIIDKKPNMDTLYTYTPSIVADINTPLSNGTVEKFDQIDSNTLIATINNIGTEGSSDESIRHRLAETLIDDSSKAFFKIGDRAAILLITDEDDPKDNLNSDFQKIYSPATQVSYDLNVSEIKVQFNQDITLEDGTIQTNNGIVPYRFGSSVGKCANMTAQDKHNLALRACSLSMKNCSAVSCSDGVTVSNGINLLSIYTSQLSSQKFDCSSSNFQYLYNNSTKIYLNTYETAIAIIDIIGSSSGMTSNNIIPTSCKTIDSISLNSNLTLGQKYFEQYHDVSQDTPLNILINRRIRALFGEDFYFGSIILLPNDTPAKAQSVGLEIKALTDSLNGNSHSINNTSYENGLNQIATFIQKIIKRDYTIDANILKTLKSVEVLKLDKTSYKLKQDQDFKIIENIITLVAENLNPTDQIIITY